MPSLRPQEILERILSYIIDLASYLKALAVQYHLRNECCLLVG